MSINVTSREYLHGAICGLMQLTSEQAGSAVNLDNIVTNYHHNPAKYVVAGELLLRSYFLRTNKMHEKVWTEYESKMSDLMNSFASVEDYNCDTPISLNNTDYAMGYAMSLHRGGKAWK